MRILASFILICLFFSCNKPYNEKPKDLLSKSEMVDIMVDLYINQQMINAVPVQSGTPTLNLANDAVYIFDKHETTVKIFEDSYKYYFTDPKTYNKILDNVKDDLKDKLSEEALEKFNNINAEADK